MRTIFTDYGASQTCLDRLAVEGLLTKENQSVETTQIYTHVMQKPGLGVPSPLDALGQGELESFSFLFLFLPVRNFVGQPAGGHGSGARKRAGLRRGMEGGF